MRTTFVELNNFDGVVSNNLLTQNGYNKEEFTNRLLNISLEYQNGRSSSISLFVYKDKPEGIVFFYGYTEEIARRKTEEYLASKAAKKTASVESRRATASSVSSPKPVEASLPRPKNENIFIMDGALFIRDTSVQTQETTGPQIAVFRKGPANNVNGQTGFEQLKRMGFKSLIPDLVCVTFDDGKLMLPRIADGHLIILFRGDVEFAMRKFMENKEKIRQKLNFIPFTRNVAEKYNLNGNTNEAPKPNRIYIQGDLYVSDKTLLEGGEICRSVDKIVFALGSGLCPTGTKVFMMGFQFSYDSFTKLIDGLKNEKCPQDMLWNLTGACVGDDGLTYIAKQLKSGGPKGLHLVLADNKITDEGIRALASMICSPLCPENFRVYLGEGPLNMDNSFTEGGLGVLANALLANPYAKVDGIPALDSMLSELKEMYCLSSPGMY